MAVETVVAVAGYLTWMDFDGSGNLIYLGKALLGSSKSDAVCQIRKLIWSGTNPTDILFANGSLAFNMKFDDRATLSYS
jgi:hypothetical protein